MLKILQQNVKKHADHILNRLLIILWKLTLLSSALNSELNNINISIKHNKSAIRKKTQIFVGGGHLWRKATDQPPSHTQHSTQQLHLNKKYTKPKQINQLLFIQPKW